MLLLTILNLSNTSSIFVTLQAFTEKSPAIFGAIFKSALAKPIRFN